MGVLRQQMEAQKNDLLIAIKEQALKLRDEIDSDEETRRRKRKRRPSQQKSPDKSTFKRKNPFLK